MYGLCTNTSNASELGCNVPVCSYCQYLQRGNRRHCCHWIGHQQSTGLYSVYAVCVCLSGAAGAVDEETFVRSFEDVGKIHVSNNYFFF